jgi:hypothetical protein
MNIATNEKKHIPGAIIVYSCYKHKETRLKELALKHEYCGWKVFYILGNPHLETYYKFETEDNTGREFVILKCEDSYLHLLKKVILSLKVLYEKYDIENGVLRCGDDLVFNEDKINNFIKMRKKSNYMGVIARVNYPITKIPTNFMLSYYVNHQDELKGLNLTLQDIFNLNEVPACCYTGGVVVYLSTFSCKILIDEMTKISWNIFAHKNEHGYPYIIEDIGIGYILNNNNIFPERCNLYSSSDAETRFYYSSNDAFFLIASHTNKYK